MRRVTKDRISDDWPLYLIGALVVACVATLAILIPIGIRQQNAWEEWCRGQGGHVTSHDETVTTVGGNGKVGVGVSTTYFCLSADGRVIDVQ